MDLSRESGVVWSEGARVKLRGGDFVVGEAATLGEEEGPP